MCKRENISFQEKICPAYDTSHRNSTDGSVVWGCTCPNHDKSRRISRYALFRPNFTVRFRAMFTVQGIRPDFTVRFRAMFTVQSLPARFHSAISGHVYSAEPSGQISQCDFGHVYSVGPTGANLYPSKRPCLSSAQSAQISQCDFEPCLQCRAFLPDFTVRFRPCLQCRADWCQLVPFKTAMLVQRTVCPELALNSWQRNHRFLTQHLETKRAARRTTKFYYSSIVHQMQSQSSVRFQSAPTIPETHPTSAEQKTNNRYIGQWHDKLVRTKHKYIRQVSASEWGWVGLGGSEWKRYEKQIYWTTARQVSVSEWVGVTKTTLWYHRVVLAIWEYFILPDWQTKIFSRTLWYHRVDFK